MILSDPAKAGKTYRFPKWGLAVIVLTLIGSGFAIARYNSYVKDIKFNIAVVKQEEELAQKTNMEKQSYIESLEQTTAEQEKKLLEVEEEAKKIQEQIEKIKDMKDEIDEKLGGDGASKEPEAIQVVDSSSEELKTSFRLMRNEITPRDLELTMLASNDSSKLQVDFNAEYEEIYNLLDTLMDDLETEYEEYDERNQKVDELLPYWAALPSGYPLKGTYITSNYGYRKNPFNSRKKEFHIGVDLKAYYKQQVNATGKGTVVSAKYDGSYGYCILIDHGYGLKTRYAHNSKLLVKVGTIVERGTAIALAGSTGRSTGTHLHYEVIKNGKTVNPKDYMN